MPTTFAVIGSLPELNWSVTTPRGGEFDPKRLDLPEPFSSANLPKGFT